MDTPRQSLMTSIGLLILRLGVGGYMMAHGWGKLQMVMAGDFDKMGDPIGIGPGPSLVGVMFAEFVCAFLVIIGLATRFAGLVVVFAMGVAAFVAHANDPWTMGGPGPSKEPAMLFLFPFLMLVFTGPGVFSVDYLIWPYWRALWAKREGAA